MPTFSNTAYNGTDVATGAITASLYTGSPLLNGALTYTLTGTFNKVGDTISVVTSTGGVAAPAISYTYEGYYTSGGTVIYVFAVNGALSNAVAIAANGSVPPTSALQTLTTTGTIPVCFLRGTAIATPDGETTVEALAPGDLVATLVDGETVFAPVRWVGSRRMQVRPASASTEDYPVRIRAGAFRDGVPSRDLLVTSEHCLFADGHLVPARMLVNGASIIVDTGITDYEFFHVELDRHSILLAEGLEAESYLDTGNRGNFAGDIQALHPDFSVDAGHKTWETDAAAPLGVARDVVEPIWSMLADRAATLGFAAAEPAKLVNEPALRLLTDTGLEIEPTFCDGSVYAFVVPGNVTGLRLASRTARPSETVGPFVDDRRDLGVLVGRLGVSEGRRRIEIGAHLSAGSLSGWHGIESVSARWTAGNAALPIDLSFAEGRPVFLDIEVLGAGPYLQAAKETLAA